MSVCPGPLMEKRVFMNDKMQYYVKRYVQVREQSDLQVLQKKVNFHQPEEQHIALEMDESSTDITQNKTERLIGLKLKPI